MFGKKRRGHNEGSVYYVADRDCWVAEISIAPGKRKKVYCKSKQEAIKKRNEMLRELEKGTLATGPQQKVGAYLEYWLEEVHKHNLRTSSYVKYRKLINSYILPALGDIVLQKLTPQQVQALYTKMRKQGLSTKTVNSVHGLLHNALKNAVRWNLVSRNVCEQVSPPPIVKRKVKPLTLDQARRLLDTARGHRLEALLTMAIVTGMRRGELLALRWSDIDFERRIVMVCRTVDYIAHYGYVETDPKTESGIRQIVLPVFLLELLYYHYQLQAAQRMKLGEKWENRDLVFCDLRGGYLNSRYLLKMFANLLAQAGLPHIHFHDLRHSAATLLLSMGVNVKVIQELLGHSDISITLGTYSHLLPTMQADAMDKWDQQFPSSAKDEIDADEEEDEEEDIDSFDDGYGES